MPEKNIVAGKAVGATPFEPKAEQMALWPDISGNVINGQGERGEGF
ncbi:MAG: hypothetical protein JKY32_04935 [Rhizobiales bacterium]|nr:hypothetical protein [Hyphomicrobiales bacterium]